MIPHSNKLTQGHILVCCVYGNSSYYNMQLFNMRLQRVLLGLASSSSSVGQVHPPTLASHPAVYFEIVSSLRLK